MKRALIAPFLLLILQIASFRMWAQPCTFIQNITCGNTAVFAPGSGAGDAAYANGLGTFCYNNSGAGGKEQIYKFKATETGTYQFQTLTTSPVTVEYFYKSGSQDACLGTGWSCLGYTTGIIQLDALNLNANDSIWVLANSESSVTAATQNFQINCAIPFACENIEVMTCGVPSVFSVGAGYGDPIYTNGMGTTCYNNSGQGGGEAIYQFTADQTGTYNFSVVTSSSSATVGYFYKSTADDPCIGTGWTCLGYTGSGTGIEDGINLNAGESIYVLANTETSNAAVNQTFQFSCVNVFACEEITTIACGVETTFETEIGFGSPLFTNGVGTGCYNNSGQGGDEQIYQFTANETGTYYIEVTSVIAGGTVEYFYKSSGLDPCEGFNWICLGYRSSPGALDAINLSAGESIFMLVNAESATVASNQSFRVNCAEPFACTQIEQITCGNAVVFTTSAVLGNPEFYNGVGTSCYNNSGQGGQEAVYQFTAPSDGTYQFRTTNVGSGVVEYLYKSATLDPCENFNWICLGYTSSITNLDAINLLAGESIWLLVNAESSTIAANQTFVIDCGIPFACTQIEEIECGVAVVFNPGAGLGDPNFYNGLGTICYSNSGQGGRERIYSFTAPTTGTYLFETLNAGQATYVDYMYKSATLDACDNFSWTCLNYTGSAIYLDAINLNAGETIWICANAESTSGANQVFQVRCAQPYACNAMEQITCGSVITYQSTGGYGNPLYFNGLGSSCYSSSGQGGSEKIYQFVAPETGTFSFSVTNVPAGGIFEYFTLAGNLDPCSNVGWQCLNYRSTPGALGTRTLTEGELIYILVNTESITSYAQSWQVSCVTSGPININATQTNVLCNGSSTGAIDITVTGGVQPYSYDWSDISGSLNVEDRTGLSAGNYSVTVTDANGTEATRDFTITEAAPLQILSFITPPSTEGGTDGSISLILVGAPGPYNTNWDDMLGTNNPEDRTNLAEGQYCVTITDANACVTNVCFDVYMGSGDPLTVEANIDNPLCNGDENGSISLLISGGTQPYTIDWSDLPGVDNQLERTGLSDGVYEVTVTDNGGSQVTQEFNVNDPAILTLGAIVQNASSPCDQDGSITLQVAGGIAPYTYVWNGSLFNGNQWAGLEPGEYCVEVTDANNCVVQDCFTLIGNDIYDLLVDVQTTLPLCNGEASGSILVDVLNGCGPYNFDWLHIDGTDNSSSIFGLAAGVYQVVVTDVNGMTVVETITISEPMEITLNATIVPVITPGGNNGAIFIDVIGGSGPFIFDWSDLSGSGQPEDRTNLEAGEYCVDVTDANGCSASTCFTVDEQIETELDVIVMQSNVSCFNGNNGFISLNVSGGIPPYVFDWEDIAGSDDGNIREDLTAGFYSVVVTDQDGNVYAETFEITQPSVLIIDEAVVNASSSTSNDGSVDLSVTGGVGPYTYDWSHLDFQNEPEDLNSLLPGEYCVVVTDFNGCSTETCVIVEYSTTLAYIINDVTCFGLDNGSILIEVSGGTEPYEFDWSDLPGIDMVESRFNLEAGTYALTITDAMNITDDFVFVVGEPSLLQGFLSATDASGPDNADGAIGLNVLGGTPPYQFDWADLAGSNDPEDRTALLPGQYCVSVLDANQCEWTGCVDVGFDIAVQELEDAFNWNMYPNPCKDEIRIEADHGLIIDTLVIYDASGREVFATNIVQGMLFPNLESGIYAVRVFSGESSSVKTLIRQ